MPIFSELFGSSQGREIKKLFVETQKRGEREIRPLGEVGRAIIQASTNCRDAGKELINMPTEKERLEREVFILYEYIYFYIHLTMRHAFVRLAEPQIRKLQGYLGPLTSSVAIDSYFAHWPDDLKHKMTSEFFDKLNETEMEYTECTRFDSSEHGAQLPVQKLRALFMKLASNVSSLSGQGEKDIAVIAPIAEMAITEWKKMGARQSFGRSQEGKLGPRLSRYPRTPGGTPRRTHPQKPLRRNHLVTGGFTTCWTQAPVRAIVRTNCTHGCIYLPRYGYR